MTTEKKNTDATPPEKPKGDKYEQLHTDPPISEKDEVKEAEHKMKKRRENKS